MALSINTYQLLASPRVELWFESIHVIEVARFGWEFLLTINTLKSFLFEFVPVICSLDEAYLDVSLNLIIQELWKLVIVGDALLFEIGKEHHVGFVIVNFQVIRVINLRKAREFVVVKSNQSSYPCQVEVDKGKDYYNTDEATEGSAVGVAFAVNV
jgi:hypothetical protein